MKKVCGYSFWGFLGDVKMDAYGKVLSTPDGNAFYSWCIMNELMNRGYKVIQIMPDRDAPGCNKAVRLNNFSSWAQRARSRAYFEAVKVDYYETIEEEIKYAKDWDDLAPSIDLWDRMKGSILEFYRENFRDMEFILHEYRMLIPGRNDRHSIISLGTDWQPDYLIQECIFEYCKETGKRLILFDLDYKLTYDTYNELRKAGCSVVIFELGRRWERIATADKSIEYRQVYIPFDFDYIHYFRLPEPIERKNKLVYVGNRYERDWCIDKYIPRDIDGCMVYGNWLEGGRDSAKRWLNVTFGKRLQTIDMREVYANSAFTILFAKKEYCENEFMTARIIESVFYGSVPLFIEEYGEEVIKKFAGDYAEALTVRSAKDVCLRINDLLYFYDGNLVNIIIDYLRDHLRFMDVRNFVDILMEVK